jgi:3-hydroxyethyl bacteriochlorophyllide a dehydrogenase
MGYPLVPGYESIGMVIAAPKEQQKLEGKQVFIPGAKCFGAVRGIFGASSSRPVVDASRLVVLPSEFAALAPTAEPTLLALAATAHHIIQVGGLANAQSEPSLIIGHGVLGRLLARCLIALGCPAPVVWEKQAKRCQGGLGYEVQHHGDNTEAIAKGTVAKFGLVFDVSGDTDVINKMVPHLKPGGKIVLGGFYPGNLSFAFAQAFMREAQIVIAAQFTPSDLHAVVQLVANTQLSLSELITHMAAAQSAPEQYQTAFENPDCLKLVFRWGEEKSTKSSETIISIREAA